ncbi:MAG: hypothetical protein GX793_00545 [Bacteroidales bacterium]|nr:hypothetical protein [Bacteroidales bacterium]
MIKQSLEKRIIFILSLFIYNILFAQQTKILTFHNFHEALPDVNVFYKDKFITSSDAHGIVEIMDSIDIIRCNYLGMLDTLIEIKSKNNRIINFSINLLCEVDVSDKYDSKLHLIKLLEKNDSIDANAKMDTSLYYKVFLKRTMLELNKLELFEGIVKTRYNKDMNFNHLICTFAKIDNYYNDISVVETPSLPRKDSLYERIPKISVYLCNDYHEYARNNIRKKYEVENIYQQNDSIIFKLTYKEKKKKQVYIEQRTYYFFVNNIISKVERYHDYDKNILRVPFFANSSISYRSITDYRYDNTINIANRKKKYGTYYQKINQTLVTEMYYEAISNPNLDFEIETNNNTITNYLPNLIKKTYPDIIIPSSPISVYKMSF